MKKWKRVIAGLLAVGMVLGTTACGGNSGNKVETSESSDESSDESGNENNVESNEESNEESSEVTTLTFWNTFTASDGDVLRAIVDDFNATNESVQIDMEIMQMGNFSEMLPPAISTGTAPDFVVLPFLMLADYVSNGTLKEMDNFWNYDGVDKSDFMEGAVTLGTIDGTQYFIPMSINTLYLYWNKDLFKNAGLDENTPPETWNELAEMATKMTDVEKNISGYAFPIQGNGNDILYNWMIQNGGRLLSEDYTKSEFASSQNLEILKAIQQMIVTDGVGPQAVAGSEADNLMNAGQLGLFINGPWLNNGLQANEINYGVATIPQVNPEEKRAILAGTGFAIPASTDESKVDAIYEFVSFWNSKEAGTKWSLETGFPPVLHTVANNPEVMNNPIVSQLIEQVGFAEPFLPGFSKRTVVNNDIINPMIEQLLQGEDPEELMNKAHDAINELLAQ